MGRKRTEANAVPEHIHVYAEEGCQASREQQVEARHPAADDGALLQALLSELSADETSRFRTMPQGPTEVRCLRRDGHKGLHTRVLEHREGDDKPERHRQVLDRLEIERPLLDRASMPAAARLVGDVVPRAEVAVKEEDGDGAGERECGNEGADPEGPRVRPEVGRDDVRGGLASELREVGDAPDGACR